jgi:hypothetical protein
MNLDKILWMKSYFHGIKFIHEIIVARRDIPWLGTPKGIMVFNDEPNFILQTP